MVSWDRMRGPRFARPPSAGASSALLGGRLLLALACAPLACDGDLGSTSPKPEIKLLVPGNARLAGDGWRACSGGGSASAAPDRWCAFFRPLPEDPDHAELWVINVTQVLAGKTLPCDGSSPGCLRLTDRLFTGVRLESPSHPEAHHFEGDTLFFLAEAHPASQGLNRYEGYIWAWRPGWTRARAISTDRGVLCRGSEAAAIALCVDGVSENPLAFDLRAGPLVDRDDSLLAVVERIAPLREGDLAWSAAFSSGGDSLVYSSWRDGDGFESLRTIPVTDIGRGAATPVIGDGRYWILSRDGQTVYFVRGGSRRTGVGELWAANFPSGTGAMKLADGALSFEALAGRGVAFTTDPQGLESLLHIVRDWRLPGQSEVLVEDTHAYYSDEDGRFVYALQSDDEGERGYVGNVAGASVCPLGSGSGATAYSPLFMPRLGLLSWTERDPVDGLTETTFLARPDDCGGVRSFGARVDYYQPVGTQGLLFGAAGPDDLLSLFYDQDIEGGPLGPAGEPLLVGFDRFNAGAVGETPAALVVGTGATTPGGPALYLFGPLR